MAVGVRENRVDLGAFKTKVLSGIDIVELISRSVTLKKQGKDFVGLCPFHQEKSPSFHVSQARQFFYCFGCKKAGDAINFIKFRDRVEFMDALRVLAESIGMEIPRLGGVGKQKAGERQALYDMHSAAGAFFTRQLEHPQLGQAARNYLVKRGFTEAAIRQFQIGFAADGWDGLIRGPVGKKFTPEQLAVGGLVKKREGSTGFYDTFRNRLMFPIRDESGRVIAFGGREMPGAENPPKYLNSPETPLFSKSRCVFGLDLAKQKIVETRTAVVVEGYTDVVMAHQYGASNVVATLGTAMTEQHVNILRRFADRIVLLYDADTAGDTAVDRAVGLFLTQEVDIAVATMPQGVDPDEYLLAHGADGFNQMIASASDALDYKWKQLLKRFADSGDSLTSQQKAVEQYLELLAGARGSGNVDSIRWGMVLAQVARLTEIPLEQLSRRFKASIQPPARLSAFAGRRTFQDDGQGPPIAAQLIEPADPLPPVRRHLTARERAERRLLGVLLMEPGLWLAAQRGVTMDDFTDVLHQRLAQAYWSHQQDEGEPVFNEFLSGLDDENLRELSVVAVEEVQSLEAQGGLPSLLNEAMTFLIEARQTVEERRLISEMPRENPEGEADLLKKLQERARQPNLRRI